MASRLMFSQPFLILTLASARRSWSARVIWEDSVSMYMQTALDGARRLSNRTDLGDLRSAQDLVGNILRVSRLECSRHG